MKKIIFFLVLLIISVPSQHLDVIIYANKTEIGKSIYKRGNNDLLKISSVLYNRSVDTVTVKFDRYFELDYTGEEPVYSNCFRLYEIDSAGKYLYYPFDTYEAFVTIAPGDSIVNEGYYTVSWPCRGAPPAGDWSLDLKFYKEITEEDNYYIVKSRYTDFASKEMKKAWTGILSSNTLKLKIKR